MAEFKPKDDERHIVCFILRWFVHKPNGSMSF